MYVEITALSMNRLWATRTRGSYIPSSAPDYDCDYNIVVYAPGERTTGMMYWLDSNTLREIPCAQMEQLVHHISRDHQQALLILHTTLQGKCYN